MTSGLKLIATVLLGLSVLAASYGDAAAKRLSSKACVKLVSEHAELAMSGAEKAMNGDPENAGAALKKEQLARIERFLFIEGQIRFRCPEIKLPGLGAPKPSKTQAVELEKNYAAELKKKRAAKLEKKRLMKQKGLVVPLPERKPKPPSKSTG